MKISLETGFIVAVRLAGTMLRPCGQPGTRLKILPETCNGILMETELTFEEYLTNKKINSDSFRQAEPDLWASLKAEFAQMHPNSFTVQKLNLINPIRRKYLLPGSAEEKKSPESTGTVTSKPAIKPGKPVIRPKLS